MPMKPAAIVFAILFSTLLAGCERPPVNRDLSRPLATVGNVDIARYAGRWYEIARFPNGFETDCVAVTATYAANGDGSLKVTNRCRKKAFDGPEEVAEGRARVVDAATNAKLAVTFFWPFEGDYWVLALAPDYSWAVVGEPSGRYLWILSRSPKISPELRADLVKWLEGQGYKTRALYWTPQP